MQSTISVKSYANLCDVSERTIRRYIANHSLDYRSDNGSNRTLIALEELTHNSPISLNSEKKQLILQADTGDAAAQNDVALLLLDSKKPHLAIYWLTLAAKQNHPDAMQHLGDCYATGQGIEKDNHLALMWVAKAASQGHCIAIEQMAGILNG